jgi:hypothetical protein
VVPCVCVCVCAVYEAVQVRIMANILVYMIRNPHAESTRIFRSRVNTTGKYTADQS